MELVWFTRNKGGEEENTLRHMHSVEPTKTLYGDSWTSEKHNALLKSQCEMLLGYDMEPGEWEGPLVVLNYGIYEVLKEEIRQANAEIRRLRRGASEIIGSPPFSPCRDSQLTELLEGDGLPLRPEWDHYEHEDDN